jgi:hypothetical protein
LSVSFGRIHIEFEKQACQLAVVNMADIHSNFVHRAYNAKYVKKMSISFLNQIYNHKIRQEYNVCIKNTVIKNRRRKNLAQGIGGACKNIALKG